MDAAARAGVASDVTSFETSIDIAAPPHGRSFTWVSRSAGARVLGGFVARLTRGLNERYLAFEEQGLRERSTRA
jgi:hypothetical protein